MTDLRGIAQWAELSEVPEFMGVREVCSFLVGGFFDRRNGIENVVGSDGFKTIKDPLFGFGVDVARVSH
jgi:hypothetical protein